MLVEVSLEPLSIGGRLPALWNAFRVSCVPLSVRVVVGALSKTLYLVGLIPLVVLLLVGVLTYERLNMMQLAVDALECVELGDCLNGWSDLPLARCSELLLVDSGDAWIGRREYVLRSPDNDPFRKRTSPSSLEERTPWNGISRGAVVVTGLISTRQSSGGRCAVGGCGRLACSSSSPTRSITSIFMLASSASFRRRVRLASAASLPLKLMVCIFGATN